MRTSIGLLTLLLLTSCATQLPSTGDPVRDAEHRLTRALVRSERAVLNDLIAPDFTCAVNSPDRQLAFEGQQARATLCTVIGTEGPNREAADYERAAQPPRSAEIESMDIRREGDAVIVVSTQAYRGWFPYDAMHVRRAQVTDTWQQRDGQWRIVRRVSEPRS